MYVLLGFLGLVVIIGIAGIWYTALPTEEKIEEAVQEVSFDKPVNIALDYYSEWLDALKSTSTNPYISGLTDEKILSQKLRTRLKGTEGHIDTEIDSVLCQTTRPQRVTGRIVSEQNDVVRVLVMARESELTGQSVFVLKRHTDGWFIDDIECAPGEFAPEREFSFEREGHLLKNVLPPLNPEYWHIVFENNGRLGNAVPLIFDATSSCTILGQSQTVCVPDRFEEGTKVHVYGQAIEKGIEVKRLEFIE